MASTGLGQRLSMDAAGVIAAYVLDGDRPLTAESNGNTTFYLYGLGGIGEETNVWSYSLPDGTNTPRQLSDLSGDITLSARYTPWGDTLDSFGTGNFTFGYLGGVLDATTGLLYVGNGQYYDPATGRFLTRDVYPNSPNPYVPWNPLGAILGPLAVVSLFYMRKKKGSKTGTFLVLLIVLGGVGLTLAACGSEPADVTIVVTPINNQTQLVEATLENGATLTLVVPVSPTTTPSYVCGGGATAIPGYKTAYLTFDDGGAYAEEIAKKLYEDGMPSTFFVNGDINIGVVAKIKDYGHVIGLHGRIHPSPYPPEAYWSNPYFNVTDGITQLKNHLANYIGTDILLRAPGGQFAPVDIFQRSEKWKPYRNQNTYFYGWDIGAPPEELNNEPAYLATRLPNGPQHAIILLHSNQVRTRDFVVSGELLALLICSGYTNFSVLPGNYPGNHPGYSVGNHPMGSALPWVNDEAGYRHFEEDGSTAINPEIP